ncbi:MAG: hypothetical protein GQF41_1721 [Candidatus Rifleibacterium amylolyticum]|nr:MAG: hypothetical protein GQF41_1721 [Candidatus Rifleibacterium amylolyticum]NLF96364.1 carboxypeptidase regulatory-like domain-containing protein [Candidatus Riflebacteria bacterium]
MSGKNLPAWAILMFFALTAMVGCSGGGSSSGAGVNTSTPESAVYELLAAWQSSQAGLVSSETGEALVEQETTGEGNYIYFKDMSGEEWPLQIDEIQYLSSSNARVYTSYLSTNPTRGSLKLIFTMFKDVTAWYLDDIEITELPIVVVTETGVKGVISDETSGLPVSGALIEIYDQATGTFAGSTTTDETGFYSFTNMIPGTYYMVIERDGYDPKTISGIIIG